MRWKYVLLVVLLLGIIVKVSTAIEDSPYFHPDSFYLTGYTNHEYIFKHAHRTYITKCELNHVADATDAQDNDHRGSRADCGFLLSLIGSNLSTSAYDTLIIGDTITVIMTSDKKFGPQDDYYDFKIQTIE